MRHANDGVAGSFFCGVVSTDEGPRERETLSDKETVSEGQRLILDSGGPRAAGRASLSHELMNV